ncbi:MAG: hypothetical protein ACI9XC_002686 [Gammaproteobacteria bacterium]
MTSNRKRVKLSPIGAIVMNTAKEIENAVACLPTSELKEFRTWFNEFDAKNWDVQIEQDIESGKLHELGATALKHHQSGETKEM